MDNKVLDEAVRIGVNAAMLEVGAFEFLSDEAQSDIVRAAILAALPVLLGKPVAWVEVGQACLGRVDEWQLRPKQLEPEDQPLYAPSLGEGDVD